MEKDNNFFAPQAGDTVAIANAPQTKSAIRLHEDWVVVILGFLIIFLALGGVRAAVPAYGWSGSDDLFGKIVSQANLVKYHYPVCVCAGNCIYWCIANRQAAKIFSW